MIRWAVGLVRRALGTLLLLLLLTSGAEVAVRLLEVQSRQTLSVGRPPSPWEKMTAPSWTVRQELRPLTNLRIKSSEGGPAHALRINSYGLRGAEVEVPKPPSIFRVLCLGDESLLGIHHSEEDHLCTQLRESLQARTKLDVEVCNAGIPGACPLTEFLLLTHRLASLQPDLIVLAVNEADLADNFQYRRFARYAADGVPLACRHPTLNSKPRTNALSTWRQEFRLVDLGLHWAGDTWRRQTEIEDRNDSEHSLYDLARLRMDRPVIDQTLQPLSPLAAWCRESYATLCVLHVPDQRPEAGGPSSSSDLFSSALHELASSQQFLLVEVPRSALPGDSIRRTAWTAEEHRQFALQLGEAIVAEAAGPWNSPYFQPEISPITPVSLQVGETRSRSRSPRR